MRHSGPGCGCLRVGRRPGVPGAARLQEPDTIHGAELVEEGEELPPADGVQREVGGRESDGDAAPHVVDERDFVEAIKNGHGSAIPGDVPRLEKRQLLSNELVVVHVAQAQDGQTNERYCQSGPEGSRIGLDHDDQPDGGDDEEDEDDNGDDLAGCDVMADVWHRLTDWY